MEFATSNYANSGLQYPLPHPPNFSALRKIEKEKKRQRKMKERELEEKRKAEASLFDLEAILNGEIDTTGKFMLVIASIGILVVIVAACWCMTPEEEPEEYGIKEKGNENDKESSKNNHKSDTTTCEPDEKSGKKNDDETITSKEPADAVRKRKIKK